MPHDCEVERFGLDSSNEARANRLARWVQTALAVYLLPVFAVVIVLGMVAIVLQAAILRMVAIARWFRLQHHDDPLASATTSSRKVLLKLFPGERFVTRNNVRCGRYLLILGEASELSWATSPSISLH